eukprot:3193234-Rhodomonas_salina.1
MSACAVCGTELAYGAVRCAVPNLRHHPVLPALPLPASYAMSATYLAYGAVPLPASYAESGRAVMCGTELAFGDTRDSEPAYGVTYGPPTVLGDVRC